MIFLLCSFFVFWFVCCWVGVSGIRAKSMNVKDQYQSVNPLTRSNYSQQ